jgi:hypothetical protein
MIVRAKFQVQEKTEYQYGGKQVVLRPQYDTTIPEDQRFAKATPAGSITLNIDNPAAADALSLGGFFYVDFTPVEPQ